jgi:hypothetical protein
MLSPFASMIFKPSEAFMRQSLQREKTSNRRPEELPDMGLQPTAFVLIVAYRDYIFLVPSVEEKTHYFLKTIIPSRKATRDYLGTGETDEEA